MVSRVGNTLIYTLLVDLPEFGDLNKKGVALLVGLAPINRERGKLKASVEYKEVGPVRKYYIWPP